MPADERSRQEEFEALRKQILNHPGEFANKRWTSLQMTHTALLANEAELRAVVRRAEADKTYLTALLTNEYFERDAYFHHLFRTLHNYLAMLVTLVDHSRNHMKSYAGTEFAREQKRRNDIVRESVAGSILRDFRNYLLHVSIPPMEFSVHWSREKPETEPFEAVFSTERLLKWSNWSSASKLHLRGVETINIGDIVDQYSEVVTTYYEWLYAQYPLLHGADIEDRNRLVTLYEQFWAPRPDGHEEKQF